MSRPVGSSDSELALKFLFANQDGVSVVLRFSRTLRVAAVKTQLMQNWPAGMAPADDAKCIRLICMGRGMLQDAQTLEAAKVPGFPTHPTPVNVSVLRRPAGASEPAPVAKAPSARPNPANPANPPTRANPPANAPPVADATPGCGCILM